MSGDLTISLEGPEPSKLKAAEVSLEFDSALDDIRSVFAVVCARIADDGRVKFVVKYAGETWPVDVATDLATLLEQMPAAMVSLGAFEIDFFEQGIERVLLFEPKGEESLNVRCLSRREDWHPPERAVTVGRKALRGSLELLLSRFVGMAVAVVPDVARNAWFCAWKREVGVE